jgi:hypothetical protein
LTQQNQSVATATIGANATTFGQASDFPDGGKGHGGTARGKTPMWIVRRGT